MKSGPEVAFPDMVDAHCLGCGVFVKRLEARLSPHWIEAYCPNKHCGAVEPILFAAYKGETIYFYNQVLDALQNYEHDEHLRCPVHLEYYLGHTSADPLPMKKGLWILLAGLGMTSQGDCDQRYCKDEFAMKMPAAKGIQGSYL